jgi:hypothetical protein
LGSHIYRRTGSTGYHAYQRRYNECLLLHLLILGLGLGRRVIAISQGAAGDIHGRARSTGYDAYTGVGGDSNRRHYEKCCLLGLLGLLVLGQC